MSPFGTPSPLATLNTLFEDHIPVLSDDELTIYFSSNRPGGLGLFDIYVADRASPMAEFGAPALLNGVNSVDSESRPVLTADGLTLYAEVKRGTNPYHIEHATRPNTSASFSALSPVATLNSTANDVAPYVLPDHRAIYLFSGRSGSNQLYRADRTGDTFATPTLVIGMNIQGVAGDYPAVSADELTLFFPSMRAGGLGEHDIWFANRSSVTQGFSEPALLSELNTPARDLPGWLSPDGCVFYFSRIVGTSGLDIYVARRPST